MKKLMDVCDIQYGYAFDSKNSAMIVHLYH